MARRPTDIEPPGPRPRPTAHRSEAEIIAEHHRGPEEIVRDLILRHREDVDELRRHNADLRKAVADLEQRKGFDALRIRLSMLLVDRPIDFRDKDTDIGFVITPPRRTSPQAAYLILVVEPEPGGEPDENLERASITLMEAAREAIARAKEGA